MITYLCSCGSRLRVADGLGGKKVRCPSCKRLAVVPMAASGFLESEDEEDTRPLPVVPDPEDDEDTRPLPQADG